MGILNQMDNLELNKVIDEVAVKIKKAGKILGTAAGDFPRWKRRDVDWFAGTSDWGAMAAGIRAFKVDCDKVR
jgi:2-keto-3-deoxy-L-rhamnonate aldolase RhmA